MPNLALLETSGLYQAIEVGARLGTAHRARLAISYCQIPGILGDRGAVRGDLPGMIENGNTFAVLMDAVRSCSLGQITDTLYDVDGGYRRNL